MHFSIDAHFAPGTDFFRCIVAEYLAFGMGVVDTLIFYSADFYYGVCFS